MADTLRPTPALIQGELRRVKARQILNPGFKGTNFMTPNNRGFWTVGANAVEISTGEFLGDYLIGVTVLGDQEASGEVNTLDELRAKLEALA